MAGLFFRLPTDRLCLVVVASFMASNFGMQTSRRW